MMSSHCAETRGGSRARRTPARPRIAPTVNWPQIELLAKIPGRRIYELNRPDVLIGQTAAERAAASLAATDPLCPRGGLRSSRAASVAHASLRHAGLYTYAKHVVARCVRH